MGRGSHHTDGFQPRWIGGILTFMRDWRTGFEGELELEGRGLALAGWGVCLDVVFLAAPGWTVGAATEDSDPWEREELGAGEGRVSGAFLSATRCFVGAAVEEALDSGSRGEEERMG